MCMDGGEGEKTEIKTRRKNHVSSIDNEHPLTTVNLMMI